MSDADLIDRRQQRTREAIRRAFIALATSRRYDDFSVGELIDKAGIGRSTFYEHYRNKDEVLRVLMDGMLAELAAASGGAVPVDRLSRLTAHFWDNRRLGKAVFGQPLVPAVRRRLAELIEQRTKAGRLRAAFLAAGQTGLLYSWLSGEVSANPTEMAAALLGQAP